MKITLITVSYNSAATIGDTLRSVVEQTHPDIEHIVIDGGSKDGTLDIVRDQGSRVSLCLSEPDRGIYDGMNKGLQRAGGEFVGFLNADDVLADPDAIARMVHLLKQSPQADAVYSDLVYVKVDDLQSVIRHWHSGDFTRASLKRGWMPPHPTFYLRRSRLVDVGEFDIRLRIAADYDFMLRCLSRKDFSVVYLPGILVRMRTGGASNRSLKALVRKSREDLGAMRRSGVGGFGTLICKNLRKIPQFMFATMRKQS